MSTAAATIPTIVPRKFSSKMSPVPEGAGDDPTDKRSANAKQHGQRRPDPLPSGQHEPGQDPDDDPNHD